MLELLQSIDNLNYFVNVITSNIVYLPIAFVVLYTAFVQLVARI